MLYGPLMDSDGVLRIGELSKRSGVSPDLLRAWERRYGLLRPVRSTGGLRLYSPADVERVRLMRRHLAEGLAAAEAAARALQAGVGEEAAPAALPPAAVRDELADALDRFDEPRAQAILDRLLAVATVDTLLSEVVLPYLRTLGERWERGDASIAQEHFASSVLRGRLLGLARGWGLGLGPAAVLACLPGEQHDLGLIAFGLALRSRGWRIVYLGTDAPIETVEEVSRQLDPSLVVLVAVSSERVQPVLVRVAPVLFQPQVERVEHLVRHRHVVVHEALDAVAERREQEALLHVLLVDHVDARVVHPVTVGKLFELPVRLLHVGERNAGHAVVAFLQLLQPRVGGQRLGMTRAFVQTLHDRSDLEQINKRLALRRGERRAIGIEANRLAFGEDFRRLRDSPIPRRKRPRIGRRLRQGATDRHEHQDRCKNQLCSHDVSDSQLLVDATAIMTPLISA